MAAATLNFFGQTVLPFVETSQLTVANANTDGVTGTYVTTHAGAARGSVVNRVDIKATGVTTAGTIRFFLSDGTNARLVGEVTVTAIPAIGAGVQTFSGVWVPSAGTITVPQGWTLKAATEKAETFNLTATGSDYTGA